MTSQPPSPIRSAIRHIRPNGIGAVSSTALGQPDLIPLWFGETDLVTPAFISDAAKKALDDGKTFYTHADGILPLREAIRDFHARTIGADISLDRITIPGAAMMAVTCALQCVVETGDNVVCVSPVWPNIFQAGEISGAHIRFAKLEEDWRSEKPHWLLDLDKLFALCDARTKAIFVASPGNPTGWIMQPSEQRAVLEFARKRGIAIISDEVYGTLVYDGTPHAPSFLQIAEPDDNVFVINSFSKPWAMTGWRVGWLVHPRGIKDSVNVLSMANNTGATVFAQYGALAALSSEGDAFREKIRERCHHGRDVTEKFIAGQNRVRWMKPEGAFYGFLNVEGLTNSHDFAIELIKKARVGVAPGTAFGDIGDTSLEPYVRICFAQDPKLLETGLERLGKAVADL
jgi:aspartate/methionine/tyrosine aminotransferase